MLKIRVIDTGQHGNLNNNNATVRHYCNVVVRVVHSEEDKSHARGSTIMDRSHQKNQARSISHIKNMVKHNLRKPILDQLSPRSTKPMLGKQVPGHLVSSGL